MKLTHLLAVALILPACNQPKTATKATPVSKVGSAPANPANPVPVNPSTPTATPAAAGVTSLVGTWVLCDLGTADDDYKSSLETVIFKDASTVEIDVKYFSDAKCSSPFTQAQANSILKSLSGIPQQDLAQYKSYLDFLVAGAHDTAAYRASAVTAAGYGEFDVTPKEADRTFLAYKVTANQLFISEPCEEEYGDSEPSVEYEPGFELRSKSVVKSVGKISKLIGKLKAQGSLALDQAQDEPSPASACGYSSSNRSIDFKDILPYTKK
ncbi:MAG: hypothetical protein EOP07_19360 [Proteobacteria bacterium]|nr:MAG: hypothetical protein EOP07_19360 [Pseudomonadota bacterium]